MEAVNWFINTQIFNKILVPGQVVCGKESRHISVISSNVKSTGFVHIDFAARS